MSSFLDRQREAFASGLASAAAKIPAKRPIPASPSPSVASTTSAAAGATPTKKPKRDPVGTIFSQPENTGVGSDIGTNVHYGVDYLKATDGALSLKKILNHLNLDKEAEAFQKIIVDRLRNNPRVTWNPDAGLSEQAWNSGTYEHRPIIPGVKTAVDLLHYLQRKGDAQGVAVKDLRDGWHDVETGITELEQQHKVLAVRNKKDNHARYVWLDDPTLCHAVDAEFQVLWHRVEVPGVDDIVRRLNAVGQKPTSEDPRLKIAATPKEKKQKKRIARRTGKSTNTHMEHLLKDYSHLKR